MAIKNVIIHQVRRDKDGERLTKSLRDEENPLEKFTAKLTDELLDLFSSANLNIGEFGVDGDTGIEPAFEQKLKCYYNNELKCTDFVGLTKELANKYEAVIVGKQLQSVKGGYLVFYQYKQANDDWLGIAILNRSEGVDVSAQLDVISSNVLDLKKLHLGASINLSKWKNGLSTRYIRFKAGLAAEVRDYFEEFIGCQRDKLAAQRETASLKQAILSHAKDFKELDDEQATLKLNSAHEYIKELQNEGKAIILSHIANRVFPESVDEFLLSARNKHDLPEDLAIHPKTLRSYAKISGRGNGMSISFDRDKFGNTVKYENGILSFHEIPDVLKHELENEINIRNQPVE